jgi:hypothetical protein
LSPARFVAAFKRWRERNREYAIQRALYKQGGGEKPPSIQMDTLRTGGRAAGHGAGLPRVTDDD